MGRRRWGRALALPGIWLAAVLLEAGFGAVALELAGRHGPALVAVALNLAVFLRFAVTLRPGRTPLITRYARCDRMGLPAECEGYTRALTAAWAGLLLAFALLHAGAIADVWGTAPVARLQAIAVTAVFLGEHVLRSLVMPQLGLATPWRTLAAIWQSRTLHGRRPHAV